MPKPVRIAIPIDMDWPLKRLHGPFSGIEEDALDHARLWELLPDELPGLRGRPRVVGYFGVSNSCHGRVGRAEHT